MRLDTQTLDDLDVFARPGHGNGLLDQLDTTRTRGGRQVLRRRLTQPLDSVAEIEAVQASLRYLASRKDAAALLPDQATLDALRRYLDARFTTLRSLGGPAIRLESAWIRWRDPDLYLAVAAGLDRTARFIAGVRRLAMQLGDAPGPLRDCIGQMWALLEVPVIGHLEEELAKARTWDRVLRLDRGARETAAAVIDRMIAELYEIDALTAMARPAHELGWVFPAMAEGGGRLDIEGLRHPFLVAPVASDVRLGAGARMVFLTGPNMAGKTTWLKAIGIAALLAHAGMPVPARACTIDRMDLIVSAIRTDDDLRAGISYFQAEARRVRTIAEPVASGLKCLVIVDELFRGTNIKDACDASLAVVRAFARAPGCRFLVASHLTELAAELRETDGVIFLHFEAELTNGDVAFDYRIRPGVSAQRLGMKVLEREGVVETLGRISV